jgi:hypothetical protein
MGTTPLTSTPAGTPERRLLAVTSAAAGVVLALSACAGPVTQALRGAPEPRTASWATGADGKAAGALPDWVPDTAADVRLAERRDGEERILSMRTTVGALPEACVPVSGEEPLTPRPAGADPGDFRRVSTLRADWWPTEQEQSATWMCGPWWVGEKEGTLYAFTPERREVPVG